MRKFVYRISVIVFRKTLFLPFIFLLSFSILHTPYYIPTIHAFTINQPAGYGIQVGGETADSLLQTIITNAITVVFAIAAVLVILFLIWGAIDWIMSGGDKEKVANARKKITSALIGLAILAFVFVIASVVGGIVGFNPLRELNIPTLGGSIEESPPSCSQCEDFTDPGVKQQCLASCN